MGGIYPLPEVGRRRCLGYSPQTGQIKARPCTNTDSQRARNRSSERGYGVGGATHSLGFWTRIEHSNAVPAGCGDRDA